MINPTHIKKATKTQVIYVIFSIDLDYITFMSQFRSEFLY